ncbi:hypothetical protein EDB86DRAFT_2960812 [Lactarius hatsudake]|nr:hypothetical protein EDB86DRAFT_2960812 [Lactarius hatsudake]
MYLPYLSLYLALPILPIVVFYTSGKIWYAYVSRKADIKSSTVTCTVMLAVIVARFAPSSGVLTGIKLFEHSMLTDPSARPKVLTRRRCHSKPQPSPQ